MCEIAIMRASLTLTLDLLQRRCVGNIAAQPEVSFGGICLDDSPVGVRFGDFVSSLSVPRFLPTSVGS